MKSINRRAWLGMATLALTSGRSLFGQERARSVLDDLPRQLDLLDLPGMPERQSQLGYEVRGKQFVVIATTGKEDARLAARNLQAAWDDMANLADRFTKVHRRPAFGIGAVQLVISNAPVREQDAPLVTLNVVGIQTQIEINVSPGQPPLVEQLPRIREATAWALLHTAEFDEQLPAWVCNGLASFAVNQGDELSVTVPELAPLGESLGGQQWKGTRTEPDVLAYPKNDREHAVLQTRFLLEGNDAEFAPTFFTALKQTVREADRYWAEERRDSIRQADRQLAERERSIADLAARNEKGFQSWLKNPLAGQPAFEPTKDASPEVVDLERQMVTVLKLARRFGGSGGKSGVRVVAFDKDLRQSVEASKAGQPRSIDDLYRTLTDPKLQPWATIGPDGRLLFSDETERLRTLLTIDTGRFQTSQSEQGWMLTTQLDSRTRLQGWLEDNPKDATRPLAKFVMVDTRTGIRR